MRVKKIVRQRNVNLKAVMVLIFIVILILLTFFIVKYISNSSYTSVDSIDIDNILKEDLEKQKIYYEISNLMSQRPYLSITNILQPITGIVSIILLFFSIYKVMTEYSNQMNLNKKNEIANLLLKLNDKEEEIRSGAVISISQYINESINEILDCLANEESKKVRGMIEKALNNINKESLRVVVMEHSKTVKDRAYILGQLRASMNFDEKRINLLLNITDFMKKEILKSYRAMVQHGKAQFVKSIKIKQAIEEEDLESEDQYLLYICKHNVFFSEITGRVIAYMIVNNLFLDKCLSFIDLSNTKLYNANLKKYTFDFCFLVNCIMRHVTFDKAQLRKVDLSGSDAFDASLTNMKIFNCNLDNINLRQSNGKKILFSETNMNRAILSEGIFMNSTFEEVRAIDTKFKGCTLSKSKFNLCIFNKSQFHNTKFARTILQNTSFYGSKCINTDFTEAYLKDIKFNGADMRGSIFKNAILDNVDFSGANLKNADFTGAKLKEVDFSKSKYYENVVFDNISYF